MKLFADKIAVTADIAGLGAGSKLVSYALFASPYQHREKDPDTKRVISTTDIAVPGVQFTTDKGGKLQVVVRTGRSSSLILNSVAANGNVIRICRFGFAGTGTQLQMAVNPSTNKPFNIKHEILGGIFGYAQQVLDSNEEFKAYLLTEEAVEDAENNGPLPKGLKDLMGFASGYGAVQRIAREAGGVGDSNPLEVLAAAEAQRIENRENYLAGNFDFKAKSSDSVEEDEIPF